MQRRDLLAFAVLGITLGAVAAFIAWPQPTSEGTFHVQVLGPDAVLFDGNVTADNTPYAVLLAAAEGRFTVESTGRGETVFVTAIDGVRNEGQGGWCIAVDEGSGWVYPQIGAGAYRLKEGAAVLWAFHADGCPSA